MKCDELEEMVLEDGIGQMWKCYDVEEVNEAIAELKEKLEENDKEIARLNDKALQYKVLDKEHCRDLNTQERRFALQIAHHKYKRCFAMARMCEAEANKCLTQQCALICFQETDRFQYLQGQLIHFSRWHRRWMNLAKKFKDSEH